MGWVGVALGVVGAVSSIMQGEAANKEAKYNAGLLEQKAGMIDVQKGIENTQYERLKRQTMGTSMANLAKSGFMPSGSPMAVMIDTQTQLEMDQAIGQYNFDVQKRYTLAEADATKRKGRQSQMFGYTNALTSMLIADYSNLSLFKKDSAPRAGRI